MTAYNKNKAIINANEVKKKEKTSFRIQQAADQIREESINDGSI